MCCTGHFYILATMRKKPVGLGAKRVRMFFVIRSILIDNFLFILFKKYGKTFELIPERDKSYQSLFLVSCGTHPDCIGAQTSSESHE